jgi:hypothetical protein
MSEMEFGSFNWYLKLGGSFVQALATLVMYADLHNLARLRTIYPQVVVAFECPDWNIAPEGFAPDYLAREND